MSIRSAAAAHALAAFVGGLLIAGVSAASAQSLTPKEAQTIAEDAYIYGYPLVTIELTRASPTWLSPTARARRWVASSTSQNTPLLPTSG